MITLSQIRPLLDVRAELNPAGNDPAIIDVTGDSRTAAAGALFVATIGESVDGHRFIASAVDRGAVAVVGTASVAELSAQGVTLTSSTPYLQVSDSRKALAWSSAALHGFPSRRLTVIGITGTDGKTSTATVLESILAAATTTEPSPRGQVGVVTTVGARICGEAHETGLHVTTPDAPLVQQYLAQMVAAGCRFAIIECTSHGLDQGRVAAVDFDVAAVTNITHEHLDYHGSWSAYAEAKAQLFRALLRSKPNVPRLAVLNADDRASFELLRTALAEETQRTGRRVVQRAYGTDDAAGKADVVATEVVYGPDRTTFDVVSADGHLPISSPLIGHFNVQNILCAVTVALEIGLSVTAIQEGVSWLQGIVGRMERIDRGQPFLALVDFAHTPASLERALQTLRTVAGGRGRVIAVFGSAGLRDREKRRLMGEVSGRLADFTVITAEDPRTEDLAAINRAIERGVLDHAGANAYRIVPDRAEAIQFAVDMARPGDIVAALGKGHERSMCFGEVEYPWSDQDVLAHALDVRLGQATA